MHSILGHSPGVSDRSPPTSPPTSVAPQSDDEFTSLVMRRAAQRLGVRFEPQHNRSYVQTAPGGTHEENDRSLLLAMAQTMDLPFPGPQTWALYGKCTADELSRMIQVRKRALGDQHVSLAPLFDTLGDFDDARGDLASAKEHYGVAAALYREQRDHRSAVTAKIAFVELRLKNFGNFRKTMEEATHAADVRTESVDQVRTASDRSALVDLLRREGDSTLSRQQIAQKLLGTRATLSPDREMGVQTDLGATQPISAAPEQVLPVTLPNVSFEAFDAHAPVSESQTTRTPADLKSLLSYLNHRRSDPTADATAATIAAIRKRMYVTDTILSAKRAAPDITSPARTVDKLSTALKNSRPSALIRSGEDLTEREVARMILESSVLATP